MKNSCNFAQLDFILTIILQCYPLSKSKQPGAWGCKVCQPLIHFTLAVLCEGFFLFKWEKRSQYESGLPLLNTRTNLDVFVLTPGVKNKLALNDSE